MTNPLQVKASDPHAGAWVSASAGTGKTKILTDRAIRLLLNMVDPSKILCITFTNAAANEMHERIMHKLEQIAASDDPQIKEILADMTGSIPDKNTVDRAKLLYENYLRSENKININTLHSYCQKILKKFPLEAGITPNFSIIDEAGQQEAISTIRKQILLSNEFEHINQFFAQHFHQKTLDDLFKNILQHRTKFINSITNNDYDKELQSELIQDLINKLDSESYTEFQSLATYPLVQNIAGIDLSINDIKNFFLTKTGSPKKRIVSAKIAKAGSSIHDELLQIQERVYQLDQLDKTRKVENFSKIISIFSAKFLSIYEYYKKSKSYLDYDDLIIKTRSLLLDQEARSWVLYKLDGGIEHILVDEAQDTSHDQWLIIEALIQEFFAELEEENKGRTIFVVGDEKQSIFSFQGADVQSFVQMNKQFTKKITAANHNFSNIQLDISYRSCSEILKVVHQLFDNLPKDILSTSSKEYRFKIPRIKAYRSNHPGKVELWDLQNAKNEKEQFWLSHSEESNDRSAISKLAQNIAEYINKEINSNNIQISTGRPITAGDFMILFRTRNQLTKEVIKELQSRSIPTSGLDRIKLSDELLIKDIVSLARFVLNPKDDLNAEAMLKAPFIVDNINKQFSREQIGQIITDIYLNNSVIDFFEEIIELFNIRQYASTKYQHDCTDSLDEFIKLLVRYATNKGSSLHGFIQWFDWQEVEIKRDVGSLDQVQIMTVHGSKGLQAPVVILCDTTSTPTQSEGFYWNKSGQVQTALNASHVPESFQKIKEQVKNVEFQEYLRLLYVAMTRAEDHLIICGYTLKKSLPENCWYELVKNAMIQLNPKKTDNKYIYQQSTQQCLMVMNKSNNIDSNHKNIIKFTPINGSLQKYLPSNENQNNPGLANQPDSFTSPLKSTKSIEYGIVFHKILEDAVKISNLGKMHQHPMIQTLTDVGQKRILKSINLLQSNKLFIQLLGGEVKTELSIGSHTEGASIGRIDLLVFKENTVHIIDYKTDKNPASELRNIPEHYLRQLESYKIAMNSIFPKHQCKKYILWLENAHLQEI